MTLQPIQSFAAGQWIAPDSAARPIADAVTGEVFAQAGNDALDVQAMLDYARTKGGPALRAMTFHDRAKMIMMVVSARCLSLRPKGDGKCQTDTSILTAMWNSCPATEHSSGSTFVHPCKVLRSISMHSIFPSGGCWKNWPRHCWRVCLQL